MFNIQWPMKMLHLTFESQSSLVGDSFRSTRLLSWDVWALPFIPGKPPFPVLWVSYSLQPVLLITPLYFQNCFSALGRKYISCKELIEKCSLSTFDVPGTGVSCGAHESDPLVSRPPWNSFSFILSSATLKFSWKKMLTVTFCVEFNSVEVQ